MERKRKETEYEPEDDEQSVPGQPMSLEEHVGEQVRRLRVERGWSQSELAEQMAAYGLDMHQTTVAKLESASRPIRINELAVVSVIFDLGADFFVRPAVAVDDKLAAYESDTNRHRSRLHAAERELTKRDAELSRAQLQRSRAERKVAEERKALASAERREQMARMNRRV